MTDYFGQQWFDKRSVPQQELIRRIHQSTTVPERLVPEEQGPSLDTQLEYAKKKFLEHPGPFSFGRIGDCEFSILGTGYLHEQIPFEHLKPIDVQIEACGLNRDAIRIRPLFLDAFRKLTFLGIHQNWPGVRETTAALMWLSGFELPAPNAVDFHLLYRLLVDGTLFSWLAGKRVWLVGFLAPDLAAQWKTKEFVETYQRFGPVDKIEIVGFKATRQRGNNEGAWLDIDEVCHEAKKVPFDVALLACGAASKILAVRIQEMGRTALDAGYIFNALLGHSERSQRSVLRDGAWPEKEV